MTLVDADEIIERLNTMIRGCYGYDRRAGTVQGLRKSVDMIKDYIKSCKPLPMKVVTRHTMTGDSYDDPKPIEEQDYLCPRCGWAFSLGMKPDNDLRFCARCGQEVMPYDS